MCKRCGIPGVLFNYARVNVEPGQCDQGAVRLSDGFIDQEGRVEVCHDNVWGSICDDGWDNTDAHVICSQLGYDKLGKRI